MRLDSPSRAPAGISDVRTVIWLVIARHMVKAPCGDIVGALSRYLDRGRTCVVEVMGSAPISRNTRRVSPEFVRLNEHQARNGARRRFLMSQRGGLRSVPDGSRVALLADVQ